MNLECDFCGRSDDVVMIRFQNSYGDIREINLCKNSWCKIEIFGEFKRFITESLDQELELNDLSNHFKIR